jgi:hypothetical protein
MGSLGVLTSRWLKDIFGDPLPLGVHLAVWALLALSVIWAYRDWKRRN